jgi:hypothetical protein
MSLDQVVVEGTLKPDGTLELDQKPGLPPGRVTVTVQPLSPASPPAPGRRWTATELRKLPAAERDAILAEQAALLQDEYRNNPELTAFEAFGDEDLYVDDPGTEAR